MESLKILTANNIANILIAEGYQGKIQQADEYVFVYTSAEGWRIDIRLYGQTPKNPDDKATSFQLWSCWTIANNDVPLIIEVSNSINNDFRFVTTSVRRGEEKSYAEVSYDYYCPDGLTDKNFVTIFENFVNVRRSFYDRAKEKYNEANNSGQAVENADNIENQDSNKIVTH